MQPELAIASVGIGIDVGKVRVFKTLALYVIPNVCHSGLLVSAALADLLWPAAGVVQRKLGWVHL